MSAIRAGAMSALLGTLLFGCEDRSNPAAGLERATGPNASTLPATAAGSQNALMRWDIVSIDFGTGTASPNGVASAFANDGSKITLHGSGTFRSNPGRPQSVTGGGTWETSTGSGTYEVTGFVSFVLAPGTFPLPHDNIGNPADARAGLAALKISYDDGSDGVLIVSCHFIGTPDTVFEGVTASKGFVDYWNREAPVALVDADRTGFHVIR